MSRFGYYFSAVGAYLAPLGWPFFLVGSAFALAGAPLHFIIQPEHAFAYATLMGAGFTAFVVVFAHHRHERQDERRANRIIRDLADLTDKRLEAVRDDLRREIADVRATAEAALSRSGGSRFDFPEPER
jgi:hypothetical protein